MKRAKELAASGNVRDLEVYSSSEVCLFSSSLIAGLIEILKNLILSLSF